MDTDLFVHFAEIAGVFVGFGALIGLRSARPADVHDVVYLRAVLMLGVWVVLGALVPIVISRYGVHDRPLWLASALVALAVWGSLFVTYAREADVRSLDRRPEPVDRYFGIVGLPLHIVIAAGMLLAVLGLWPRLDAAFYITSLAAGLTFAGYTLLTLVLSQKHETADDQAPERVLRRDDDG
ncbi:MAG: hypothetical protein ACTHJL_00805 [Amnibacterium sp.]